jgi:hypothetical protein
VANQLIEDEDPNFTVWAKEIRVNPGTGRRLIAVYHGEQPLPLVIYPRFSESIREVVHKLK